MLFNKRNKFVCFINIWKNISGQVVRMKQYTFYDNIAIKVICSTINYTFTVSWINSYQ